MPMIAAVIHLRLGFGGQAARGYSVSAVKRKPLRDRRRRLYLLRSNQIG